jgi:ABC-2 type transport system permease protein
MGDRAAGFLNMLWRKAWAESRARFLLAVLVLAMISLFVIGWQDASRVLFGGVSRTIYMLFAIILGQGGLVRERDIGTAPFTLALPVTRRRLMLLRAAAGAVELVALAAVPIVAIVVTAPFVAHPYPLAAAVTFGLRWIVGGAVLFALGFLASATVTGEYTPFVAAFVVFFGETVSLQFTRLAKPSMMPYLFTVQEVMGGLRRGPVPIGVLLVAAGAMTAAALWRTEMRDF